MKSGLLESGWMHLVPGPEHSGHLFMLWPVCRPQLGTEELDGPSNLDEGTRL